MCNQLPIQVCGVVCGEDLTDHGERKVWLMFLFVSFYLAFVYVDGFGGTIGWGRDDHGLCILFCMLYTGLETASKAMSAEAIPHRCPRVK